MIDPFKTDLEQSRQLLWRFAVARAIIVCIVAFSCLALQVREQTGLDLNTVYLYVLFGVALVESVVVVILISAGYNPTIRFSFLLLCADLALISAIIVATGGSRSMFAFLYIAAILSSSLLLSFGWTLAIATICSVLFILVMTLEHDGYVTAASAFRWQGPIMEHGELWAFTGMKIFAFYLTAFLGGCLSQRVGLLQSFHQNILNSLSSGFISVNGDCIVTFLNPAGSSLLQRSFSDVVGKHVTSVFPVASGEPNPLQQSITQGHEWHGREVAVVRGDDKVIPVGITISPLRNGANGLMGAVASFIDLTELKRMEEKLRRADRLAAIGETSTILAHEIRNPLASIRGALHELVDDLRLQDANGQLMGIAIKECDKLSKVVSDFLRFVGTHSGERERFDLAQFLEEVVQTAERSFFNGDGCILRDYPHDLGCVMGDRSKIKEAVLNVIQNGRESMPKGGTLRVGAQTEEDPSGHVSIVVEDQGNGIPPELTEKVFEPFYTTKPGGSGLGMAIAHKIIDSHGGSIDVASVLGKGTKVSIRLPRQG